MAFRQFKQHDLIYIKRLCMEAGIKLTHQRLEIYKELLSCTDHPSAELVHKRLQARIPTIAIDTVYRTLATFSDLGIVNKLHVANERTLFDTNLDIHHHFVCTRCKKVEDVYWPDLDNSELPQAVSGMGKVQFRHLELLGVCSSCMAETAEAE